MGTIHGFTAEGVEDVEYCLSFNVVVRVFDLSETNFSQK